MNVGVILIGIILVFAASLALIAFTSNANSTPVVDTFGHTHNAATNASEQAVGNITGTAADTGGNLGLAMAVLFVCGLLFGVLALILHYRGKNTGYGGR
jgi:beta-lactamase regulating signal transducer with metallopeptidase domain